MLRSKNTYRIAVATKEGCAVSEHFGHAKSFLIYDLQDQELELLEARDVDHYCHGHSGDQNAMQKILKTIADCDAVFVAKIGDGPTEKLAAIGVEAVSEFAWEPIPEALLSFAATKTEAG